MTAPPARGPGDPERTVGLFEGWTMWRQGCLRGAGFPTALALRLAAPRTVAAVERQLLAEAQLAALCERARQAMAPDRSVALTPDQRRTLKYLQRLEIPTEEAGARLLGALRSPLEEATRAARAARRERDEWFAAERRQVGDFLREVAREARFREALTWQNRTALHRGADALLRQPPGATDSQTRQHEAMIASYLTRYATKNDTIGFFGPHGWVRIVDRPEALSMQPGPALLSRREVHFEHWCIDLLAESLAAEDELLRDLAPRRMPTVWVEGTVLHVPVDRQRELPRPYARLLAACDGRRSARQIVAELAADPSSELEDEGQGYELLGELCAKRLATWTLELPADGGPPDERLRRLLQALPESEARQRALEALGELEEARDGVARAAGDADALDGALAALEERFGRRTGAAAVRRRGQMYAGRTLVYETCRRNVAVALGGDFVDRLAPTLELLLASARWYTHRLAARYLALAEGIYQGACAESGSEAVGFLRFYEALAPHLTSGPSHPNPLADEVLAELQRHWAALLEVGPTDPRRSVRARAASLRARVRELFAAPHPGWPSARYHSPDLLIAARDVAAVRRGDFLIVLGEFHTNQHTFIPPYFAREHPAPETLVAAYEEELPERCVAQVVSKEHVTATDYLSPARHHLDLEIGAMRSWRPREQVLAIGECLVERRGGRLVVRTRDGRFAEDLLVFLDNLLVASAQGRFDLLPSAAHSPRVTIDEVVVSRERWRCAPSELSFAGLKDPLERFVGARRWARARSLPRWIFVKIPEETKPLYVDLESPILVEALAKLCRKASSVALSEMLPSVEDCWLRDAEGRGYTSELRLVAVDPIPWRAAERPEPEVSFAAR